MTARVVWPVAGLLGLGLLVFARFAPPSSAQRPERPARDTPAARGADSPLATLRPPVGRFVVARATKQEIVILDTATGQLYKATPNDFKKFSELPKIGEGRGLRPPVGRAKDAPRRGDREKRATPRRDPEKKDGRETEKRKDGDRKPVDRRGTDRRKEEPKRDRKPDDPSRDR